MKKINFILAMLVVATVSCTKEEAMQPEGAQQEGKYTIMLDGSSAPATKLDMIKQDKNYNLNWSTADKVKLYSASLDGVEAAFNAYVADNDKGRATFKVSTDASISGSEELVVVYPNTLTYADGKVTGSIPAAQTQGIADNQDPIDNPRGSAYHLGQNTLAYGKTTIDPAAITANNVIPVSFTISQKAAFVMVELVGTSEFAGYELVGAKLYAKGEKLAGSVTYDPATEAVTVADAGASDVVGVEYKVGQAVVENGKYDLYFVSAPRAADATGDVTVIVTLKKKDSYETVTLPCNIGNFKIESGKVSYITLPISLEINSYEWFEPVDVRDMVGGWAYGPQNTYYVQAGATANIDVKARGEFTKVEKPVKCAIHLAAFPATRKLLSLADANGKVNDNYTIDVKVGTSNGPWGVVAIYGENDKIIWSYFICKFVGDDSVKDITYTSDIVMMDRALGQIEGNAAALTNGKFDNLIPYFQWGKKDPVLWSNTDLTANYNEVKRVAESLEETIEHPGSWYNGTLGGQNPTIMHWAEGNPNPGLWGGVASTKNFDETNIGHKTIYDPCPEGYRVPDPRVFKELTSKLEVREIQLYGKKNNNGSYSYAIKTGTDYLPMTDESIGLQKTEWIKDTKLVETATLVYKGDGFEDVWPYFGWKNNNFGYGSKPISNKWMGAIYWGNCCATNKGTALEYAYYSKAKQHGVRFTQATATAAVVRCQKEL